MTTEPIALAKVPVFTTRAYAASHGISLVSASKRLGTLERHGQVERLTRGVWVVVDHPFFSVYGCVPYLLGRELGYVSFVSALQLHGMISQIPKAVQVATTGAPRKLATRWGRFELFKLHPRMMNAGVDWSDAPVPFRLASPEKALLDTLYLATRRGRRFSVLPEIELPPTFDKRTFGRLVREQVPYPSLQTAVTRRFTEVRR